LKIVIKKLDIVPSKGNKKMMEMQKDNYYLIPQCRIFFLAMRLKVN
jgi:hypothetical protein